MRITDDSFQYSEIGVVVSALFDCSDWMDMLTRPLTEIPSKGILSTNGRNRQHYHRNRQAV
ncbi:MAG TPA: hypothetical protein VGF59_12725 [Bryobacteraceae bacterium]|jgi:hypothetical protein